MLRMTSCQRLPWKYLKSSSAEGATLQPMPPSNYTRFQNLCARASRDMREQRIPNRACCPLQTRLRQVETLGSGFTLTSLFRVQLTARRLRLRSQGKLKSPPSSGVGQVGHVARGAAIRRGTTARTHDIYAALAQASTPNSADNMLAIHVRSIAYNRRILHDAYVVPVARAQCTPCRFHVL